MLTVQLLCLPPSYAVHINSKRLKLKERAAAQLLSFSHLFRKEEIKEEELSNHLLFELHLTTEAEEMLLGRFYISGIIKKGPLTSAGLKQSHLSRVTNTVFSGV